MWSGPRTLSTATMRSWENRADTVVVDEPFYAYYLAATGLDHPGRDAILADLGVEQQVALFRRFGGPVVDSDDLLRDPERTLRALCAALDVPFDPAMLSWPAGPRDTDGVWAPYWYASVEASTGFGPYRETAADVPSHLEPLAEQCRRFYDELAR